jgi:hypothetical protein
VAFFIGLFRITTIPIVGAMPVGELLLLLVLLHATLLIALGQVAPARLPAPRLLTALVLSQGIALASYVLSDLWRESSNLDMLRGWLRMIFLLVDLLTMAILLGSGTRVFVWLQAGSALSFAQLLIAPPLFNDYWKFGFAYPVTTMAVLLVPALFGFWGAISGSLFLGALHSAMDYRSLAAECLAVGFLLLLRTLPKAKRKAALIAGAIACLAVSPIVFQSMFATSGSERASRSNVERSAMLQAAWEGFAESPLLGQGSWFSNSRVLDNFQLIRAENERLAGGGMGFGNDDLHEIAIHSQLLVSLAEGGILGATFFACYGFLLLWALWFALTDAAWHWTLPSRTFLLVMSFFNLWMSPFSGPVRIEIATAAILIALFWQERTQQQLHRQLL